MSASANDVVVLDRNGVQVQAGQQVEILTHPFRHMPAHVSGELVSLDCRFGVCEALVRLEQPARLRATGTGAPVWMDVARIFQPGEEVRLVIEGEQQGQTFQTGRAVRDVEHGRESWLEVRPADVERPRER